MKTQHILITVCVLFNCMLFLNSCNTKPKTGVPFPMGPDSTPPSLQVLIKSERTDIPNTSDSSLDITNQNITKVLGANTIIRVVVIASDAESGIKNIEMATVEANDGQGVLKKHNLRWSCVTTDPTRGDRIVGILELDSLRATPAIIQPNSVELTSANFTVDPVSQTGCGGGNEGLEGWVRIIVTNGGGVKNSSQTFNFSFQ